MLTKNRKYINKNISNKLYNMKKIIYKMKYNVILKIIHSK